MKHTIALLTLLLSVLTVPATLVRFNMADITGRTNDLPITVSWYLKFVLISAKTASSFV